MSGQHGWIFVIALILSVNVVPYVDMSGRTP